MEGKTAENAESALKMKEIIGTLANGSAGLSLHPLRLWSNKSTIIILRVRRIARHCWTKETGRMNQVEE